MEILDLVDGHNKVIGQASRKDCHEKHLLHRAAHILIFNPEGELLVQKRSASKDVFPGHWEGSVSGHVNAEEVVSDAAIRELHEEVGICVPKSKLKKLLEFGVNEETEHEWVSLYLLEDYYGRILKDEEEVDRVEWWPKKKVEEEIKKKELWFTPGFLKAWNCYNDMA